MTREEVYKGLEQADAYFRSSFDAMYGTFACEKFRSWVDAIEHAIALLKAQEPEVHGRWITYPECLAYEDAYHDEHIVCSACHSVWNIIDNDTERFDYCPVCGAKMDEEV